MMHFRGPFTWINKYQFHLGDKKMMSVKSYKNLGFHVD